MNQSEEVQKLLQNLGNQVSEDMDIQPQKEVDQLQRTDQWHEDRRGNFTASSFGKLMTCKNKSTIKNPKDWGKSFWLLNFGDTAKTYIIEKAIERISGESIKFFTTYQMQWGIDHEDEGKEYTENTLSYNIEEVGFIKFLKNAGASPDGKILYSFVNCQEDQDVLENNSINVECLVKYIGYELKCPETIQSHYKLMTTSVSEGHDYFWQVTGEMLALETDRLLFATYHPAYPEKYRLSTQMVELSKLHVNALYFRLIVAEKLVLKLVENLKADINEELIKISAEIPEDFDGIQEYIKTGLKELAI